MLRPCCGLQLLQFIDLGGHEKYLKTALFGMTCLMPDYVILTVAAPRGLDKGTLEHLAAALTLQLPTVIIMTKVCLLTGLAISMMSSTPACSYADVHLARLPATRARCAVQLTCLAAQPAAVAMSQPQT